MTHRALAAGSVWRVWREKKKEEEKEQPPQKPNSRQSARLRVHKVSEFLEERNVNDVSGHLFLNDDSPASSGMLPAIRQARMHFLSQRSLSSKNSQKWRLVGTGMAGEGDPEILGRMEPRKGERKGGR